MAVVPGKRPLMLLPFVLVVGTLALGEVLPPAWRAEAPVADQKAPDDAAEDQPSAVPPQPTERLPADSAVSFPIDI